MKVEIVTLIIKKEIWFEYYEDTFYNHFFCISFRLNDLVIGVFLGRNMHFSSRNRMSEQPSQDISTQDPQKSYISVAQILGNRQVCFANQKLPKRLPRQRDLADRYIDVINTFIMFMNHRNQSTNIILRNLES